MKKLLMTVLMLLCALLLLAACDGDPNPTGTGMGMPISSDEAIEAALADPDHARDYAAGLLEHFTCSAGFTEDDTPCYIIRYDRDGTHYAVTVHALTGAVLLSDTSSAWPADAIGEAAAIEKAVGYLGHFADYQSGLLGDLSCVTDYTSDGEPCYIVRYDWWTNHYEHVIHAVTGNVLRMNSQPSSSDPLPTTPKPTEPQPTETEPQPTETEPTKPMPDTYDSIPDSLYAAVYDSAEQHYYERYDLDVSNCVEGWLYVFNKDTGKPTLICGEPVVSYDTNCEHIYYVTEQDPSVVIRATLDGAETKALPVSGNITYLDYFGGKEGSLGLVDSETDILVYDLASGQKTKIFSYHRVAFVYFDLWQENHIELKTSYSAYWICNTETGEMLPEVEDPRDTYIPSKPYPMEDGITMIDPVSVDPDHFVSGPLYFINYTSYCTESKRYTYGYLGHSILICEEPVVAATSTRDTIYYVKESEPNTIYSVPKSDLTNESIFFTSDAAISCLTDCPYQYANTAIAYVENRNTVVWHDLATGERTLYELDVYYIRILEVDLSVVQIEPDGQLIYDLPPRFYFEGKLTEDQTRREEYLYNPETGECKLRDEI